MMRSHALAASIAAMLAVALGASSLPAGAPMRSLVAQPFAADSIWNTPIGTKARYAADTDPETRMLRSPNVGGPGGSYTWVATDTFTVYRTTGADPVVTWRYAGRSATAVWPFASPVANGSVKLPTPRSIAFGGGSDQWAVLIMPDGRTAYEMWKAARDPAGDGFTARYLVRTDLAGPGIASGEARSEGIRAFGGSLLGGLIRCAELERADIPHAVAMLLSNSQLRRGATLAQQKTWPATLTDRGGDNGYAGLVPMGALVAIRPDVDLNRLGLSREGLALARAYQHFGGYVVDRATSTMTIAVVEKGCRREVLAPLHKDKLKLLPYFVRVLNNGPNSVGGGGRPLIAPPPPPAPTPVGWY